MELLEGQARLDTKLVDEDSPSFLVGLERFRLSIGAIENEHQLTAQSLPKRVLSDKRLDLANERSAATETRSQPRSAPRMLGGGSPQGERSHLAQRRRR